jgi:2-dehydropantoate 2-reductase
MRVGVVGAGAIGGFLAAALARSGVPVAVVARGAHLAAIRRDGLRIESDLGAFTARVDASESLRALGDFDVLLLTFKAHQWPALLDQLARFSGTRTTVTTLQNGLPFWYLRTPPLRSVDPDGKIGRLFGDEQVIGGVVHVSGDVPEPGLIRQSGGLRYLLGAPQNVVSAGVEALVELLRAAGLQADVDSNIRASVWLKLVNNAGLNTVSVLRRATIKRLLSDTAARHEVRDLMSEALLTGRALGVVSDVDIDARLDYAARLDDVKTSMLQDYERGRALELDPIVGAVIEVADRCGVAVPHLRAAYIQLHRAAGAGVPADLPR